MNKVIYFLFFFVIFILPSIFASDGDQSPFYLKCVKKCRRENCTTDGEWAQNAETLQDTYSKLLMWNCHDECRYHCMWRTVAAFLEHGYNVPKFHGKWPFKRFMGLQEPMSVFASFLNLACTIYMHRQMWGKFRVMKAPMILFWHVFALVCEVAWVWSMTFHARDTLFTEFMDYSLALAMVMMLFISAVVRLLYENRWLRVFLPLPLVSYYAAHVSYLREGQIDYDYNMQVNVFFGVCGGVLWLWWSCVQVARGARHAWRLLLFSVWSGSALALELLDSPPLYGWDTHALWHLTTSPLPLLFYRFVMDDVKYLQSKEKEKDKNTLRKLA